MSDTFSIKRDGTVWYGRDAGAPGKWTWFQLGWVKKTAAQKWTAVSIHSRGQDDYVCRNCPTRHEAVMALRWPEDIPEVYR